MAGTTYLLVLMNIAAAMSGVGGQEIEFENVERVSPCSEGLRAGIDTYLINGTVGPNVTALTEEYWASSVEFGVFNTSTSQFTPNCTILIGSTGRLCNSTSTDPCYCDQFNDTTGLAHVVVRYTANLTHSQNILLFQWLNSNASTGLVVYSDQNISLPAIYDVTTADLVLTVNDHPAVETDGYCDSSFIANTQYTFMLCCNKTASPCYPKIAFGGTIVAEYQAAECVNYTFTMLDNITATMNKSYSVCSTQVADVIQNGSCKIGTREPNPKDLTLEQRFAVGFGTIGGIIVIVIIVIIVVCCCCKKNATLVCCCCCTEKGISIYCCCYDGKIVSTACCSCKPLSNGGNDWNAESPASGGQWGLGVSQSEYTGNTAANRSKDNTSGVTQNVE